MQLETPTPAFAERVEERREGACRLFVLPTPVPGFVAFRGSFRTGPDFARGEDLVQDLAVLLLDKGTRRRDRFALAEILENRGAELDFISNGLRVTFTGRVLREDLAEVLPLVAEQLREPCFDPEEFEKARAHMAAALHRSQESTATQAAAALARRIYPPDHPNYRTDPAADLARLAELSVDDVRAYHERHFGGADLTVAFVGDVEAEEVAPLVRTGLGDWPPGHEQAPFAVHGLDAPPSRVGIPMPDKQNVDVRMGHRLPVRRQDAAYVPLYVGTFILGGNFSARLMSTVRDEMGLTYGIHASLHGVTSDYEGHWQIGVTLSQENLQRGIEATLEQVRRFVQEGVTGDELAEKKETVSGRYKVDMATTRGLAALLLRNAERGFDVGYLDRFPAEVEALTLEEVNDAITTYLDPDRLHLAMAGSLPDEGSSTT